MLSTANRFIVDKLGNPQSWNTKPGVFGSNKCQFASFPSHIEKATQDYVVSIFRCSPTIGFIRQKIMQLEQMQMYHEVFGKHEMTALDYINADDYLNVIRDGKPLNLDDVTVLLPVSRVIFALNVAFLIILYQHVPTSFSSTFTVEVVDMLVSKLFKLHPSPNSNESSNQFILPMLQTCRYCCAVTDCHICFTCYRSRNDFASSLMDVVGINLAIVLVKIICASSLQMGCNFLYQMQLRKTEITVVINHVLANMNFYECMYLSILNGDPSHNRDWFDVLIKMGINEGSILSLEKYLSSHTKQYLSWEGRDVSVRSFESANSTEYEGGDEIETDESNTSFVEPTHTVDYSPVDDLSSLSSNDSIYVCVSEPEEPKVEEVIIVTPEVEKEVEIIETEKPESKKVIEEIVKEENHEEEKVKKTKTKKRKNNRNNRKQKKEEEIKEIEMEKENTVDQNPIEPQQPTSEEENKIEELLIEKETCQIPLPIHDDFPTEPEPEVEDEGWAIAVVGPEEEISSEVLIDSQEMVPEIEEISDVEDEPSRIPSPMPIHTSDVEINPKDLNIKHTVPLFGCHFLDKNRIRVAPLNQKYNGVALDIGSTQLRHAICSQNGVDVTETSLGKYFPTNLDLMDDYPSVTLASGHRGVVTNTNSILGMGINEIKHIIEDNENSFATKLTQKDNKMVIPSKFGDLSPEIVLGLLTRDLRRIMEIPERSKWKVCVPVPTVPTTSEIISLIDGLQFSNTIVVKTISRALCLAGSLVQSIGYPQERDEIGITVDAGWAHTEISFVKIGSGNGGGAITVMSSTASREISLKTVTDMYVNKLREACGGPYLDEYNEAKKVVTSLSMLKKYTMECGPNGVKMDFTQDEFFMIIIDLYRPIMKSALRSFKLQHPSATVNWATVSGGGSHCPEFRDMVERYFKVKLVKIVNPDEAVAIGCSYIAAMIANNVAVKLHDLPATKGTIESLKYKAKTGIDHAARILGTHSLNYSEYGSAINLYKQLNTITETERKNTKEKYLIRNKFVQAMKLASTHADVKMFSSLVRRMSNVTKRHEFQEENYTENLQMTMLDLVQECHELDTLSAQVTAASWKDELCISNSNENTPLRPKTVTDSSSKYVVTKMSETTSNKPEKVHDYNGFRIRRAFDKEGDYDASVAHLQEMQGHIDTVEKLTYFNFSMPDHSQRKKESSCTIRSTSIQGYRISEIERESMLNMPIKVRVISNGYWTLIIWNAAAGLVMANNSAPGMACEGIGMPLLTKKFPNITDYVVRKGLFPCLGSRYVKHQIVTKLRNIHPDVIEVFDHAHRQRCHKPYSAEDGNNYYTLDEDYAYAKSQCISSLHKQSLTGPNFTMKDNVLTMPCGQVFDQDTIRSHACLFRINVQCRATAGRFRSFNNICTCGNVYTHNIDAIKCMLVAHVKKNNNVKK